MELWQSNALPVAVSFDRKLFTPQGKIGFRDVFLDVQADADVENWENILDHLGFSMLCGNGVNHIETIAGLFFLLDQGNASRGAKPLHLKGGRVIQIFEQMEKIFSVILASELSVDRSKLMTGINGVFAENSSNACLFCFIVGDMTIVAEFLVAFSEI